MGAGGREEGRQERKGKEESEKGKEWMGEGRSGGGGEGLCKKGINTLLRDTSSIRPARSRGGRA